MTTAPESAAPVTAVDLLLDGFTRVRDGVHAVLDGLTPADLAHRLAGSANSIGWLVWHLTRVQDDHVADVAGTEQAWTADGWSERLGLALPVADTGHAHTDADVARVRIGSADVLAGYHDAVHDRTVAYLGTLSAADLTRVVDTRWDPPVTLAVRLVSVLDDDLEHLGQAAFVRGLLPS